MCVFCTSAEILAELFSFFICDILNINWGERSFKEILKLCMTLKNKVVNGCNYTCH